jgi:glycosyltransferase involved in cell wall biosynthesis
VPLAAKLPFSFIPFCPFAHKSFHVTENDKQAIKEKLTNGAEFFLCQEGWQTLDEALELLLAFSAFKKRMQTGMKLVLLGEAPKEKAWKEKLQTFRYREDVLVLAQKETPDPLKMIAAAWALLHLPSGPYFRTLQSAICIGTPVITWPYDAIREMAGESVYYCTDLQGESLSQNLMRIYKDEKMRSDHIKAGMELARHWDMENAAISLLNLALE